MRCTCVLFLWAVGVSSLETVASLEITPNAVHHKLPSCSRRFVGAACAFASSAKALAASPLDGEYRDPNHPDGFRRITATSATSATIVGQDGPGAPVWKLAGRIEDDSTLALKISPGTVQPPEGVTMEDFGDGYVQVFRGKFSLDGTPGIQWPDGNRWTRN